MKLAKRFLTALSLAALLVPFASAETIRFDPPNATVNRSVDAIVSGIWRDGCLPSVKGVTQSGSIILLRLNGAAPPGVACTQSLAPYTRTFHLGVLAAGSYTVSVVSEAGDSSDELGRTTLIVRDDETLSIFPYAVPTSGGEIGLENPFYVAGATLMIGGVTVPADSNIDGALFANAPAHAAGAVDVTVNSTAGTVTAKAALIYYDPGAADPAVFEPILFPLSFEGPGLFGSQWTNESFLSANVSATNPAAYFRDPLPCAGCSNVFNIGTSKLANNGNPWGHVLYAMRGTTGNVVMASRIRDTSRQSQTAGTEVPVVRETDFRGQLRFVNVPVDGRYRVTLRLWSRGDYPQFIVLADSTPAQYGPVSVQRIPGTDLWFGSADVTSLLAKAPGSPMAVLVFPSGYGTCCASILFPPIWGMLSITNNDTQQVTIVSPH
jgi:hypothetical protein